jgi:hypothetical protein
MSCNSEHVNICSSLRSSQECYDSRAVACQQHQPLCLSLLLAPPHLQSRKQPGILGIRVQPQEYCHPRVNKLIVELLPQTTRKCRDKGYHLIWTVQRPYLEVRLRRGESFEMVHESIIYTLVSAISSCGFSQPYNYRCHGPLGAAA